MSIDRARNSYDVTREWRAVLAQQGRVTLEADVNEGTKIIGEERRREAIDVVGPAASPDNGYVVSVNSTGSDVLIGPGTLYIGGWRVSLASQIATASQPAWLHMPAWPTPKGNQTIALLVTEHTVIAVEDTALQEVALGGPDSAGRLRLLQHVLRVPTTAGSCVEAAKALAEYAASNGQTYNPTTCELTSNATLQVTPNAAPTPTGPCDPPAAGGYIGVDNQMIRVAVTQYDPGNGRGTLVWGWNNASFLYRAIPAATPSTNVVTFLAEPVDPDHAPRQGQAIEVLRCTINLGDGDTSSPGGGNFIAAGSGTVMTLAAGQGYDPDSRQLTLPNNVHSDVGLPLFVRLWEAEVQFIVNTPTELVGTGLNVTIANPPLAGAIGARPFWQFAVRPSTPVQVYPQRYLKPQPPDGPRQFLATLGVVGWNATTSQFNLIANCVPPFLPLTKQPTGCCGVVLGPADVAARGGLQAVVDALKGSPAVVSLRPGVYSLTAPLTLTAPHAGLVLESCSGGVTLEAATNDAKFQLGLISISETSGVSLRRLSLRIPRIPFRNAGLEAEEAAANAKSLVTMCGIRLVDATNLTIEDCVFTVRVPADTGVIGACVFAEGTCTGLSLRLNQFDCPTGGVESDGIIRFVMGLWLSPAAKGKVTATESEVSIADAVFLPINHRFANAQITDNRFNGLTIAVLVIAQLGLVRCTDNRISNCCGGIWFVKSDMGSNVEFARAALEDELKKASTAVSDRLARIIVKSAVLAKAVKYAGVLSAALPTIPRTAALSEEVQQVLTADFKTRGTSAYSALIDSMGPTAPIDEGEAAAAPATNGAAVLDEATYTQTAEALNTLDRVSLAAEQAGTKLQPIIYLLHNDVELVPSKTARDTKLTEPSLHGLVTFFTQGALGGSLFLQGNRVEVPTTSSIAATSLWGARMVVNGNQFFQLSAATRNEAVPCAVVITDKANFLAVTGNIVHRTWLVHPARAEPSSVPTGSWAFLNTLG
jgi:hypothetical protein